MSLVLLSGLAVLGLELFLPEDAPLLLKAPLLGAASMLAATALAVCILAASDSNE